MTFSLPTNTETPAPRRRRCWIYVVLFIVLMSVLNYKPQRYYDEACVMEQIADLLDSPVPYKRREGLSTCPYVGYVYLPRVEMDDPTVRQLADLLERLPRVSVVDVRYLTEDQMDRIRQLKSELPERIFVGVVSSSSDSRESQRSVCVAGIAAS